MSSSLSASITALDDVAPVNAPRSVVFDDVFSGGQAVLEEPEVVLTLAQWGFSVHAGFEESLSPLLPDAASDSVVSDLSRDGFGGSIGGGGGGSGGGGDGGFLEAAGGNGAGDAAATATTPGLSKARRPCRYRKTMFCLLYTSPSPRDRG